MWVVINHPYQAFNCTSPELLLKLRHGWVITCWFVLSSVSINTGFDLSPKTKILAMAYIFHISWWIQIHMCDSKPTEFMIFKVVMIDGYDVSHVLSWSIQCSFTGFYKHLASLETVPWWGHNKNMIVFGFLTNLKGIEQKLSEWIMCKAHNFAITTILIASVLV